MCYMKDAHCDNNIKYYSRNTCLSFGEKNFVLTPRSILF